MLARTDPRLLPLMPLIYVAWVDGALSRDEARTIRRTAEALGADPDGLAPWLDPDDPPSADALRALAAGLGEAAEGLDGAPDLAALGLALARGAGAAADAERVRAVAERMGLADPDALTELLPRPPAPTGFAGIEPPSFDPRHLTAWIERQRPVDRAEVRRLLEDEAFTLRYDRSIAEKRAQTLDWLRRVAEAGFGRRAFPETDPAGAPGRLVALFETLALFDVGLTVKVGVQFGLFAGSVRSLGTEKHHALLRDAVEMAVPGAFAMTERGHGSNVQALETTATYDPEAGEFVVHTPHDGACKDWIGNAADDGRMATVFAQLRVGGVEHGVHALLVPLRDAEGRVLPGVHIEDCGPKMGLDGVDNGQIWFENVRVPRANLLDRFARVDEDGRYHSDIAGAGKRFFTMVGTLVGGRVCIAGAAVSVSRLALAIAVRYGARRRQFGPKGAQESLILDYPSHQRRLLPRLAKTYALGCAQQALAADWEARDLGTADDIDGRAFEARAAGLKAYASWHATDTIQACREACGGQGYAAVNRFAALKADTDIFTTFEGDNTVLMQLVARGRLTEFQKQFADARFFGVVRYFAGRAASAAFDRNPFIIARTDREHLRDMGWHRQILDARQADLTGSLGRRLQRRLAEMDGFRAFNEVQNHAIALAHAYIEHRVIEDLHAALDAFDGPADQRAVLDDLARLFGLSAIEADRGWFLENGYLDADKARAVRDEVDALCAALRPHAVSLVDAFAIPDKCLAPIALEGAGLDLK